MKEIVFSSTTRLATAIRKRKITAKKALDAFLAQINKHNPAVNAVNIIGADQAKERAHGRRSVGPWRALGSTLL
jgi:amidase